MTCNLEARSCHGESDDPKQLGSAMAAAHNNFKEISEGRGLEKKHDSIKFKSSTSKMES